MTDLIAPFFCCGADVNATNTSNTAPPDYQSGSTPLFKAIETRKWDYALIVLSQNPEEASKWVVYPGLGGLSGWRRLPIHEACIHKPTEALMTALIKANPKGVREKDSDGQLPLHHAVENGASLAVVQELLLSCPDALDVKNKWGNYPEDIAKSTSARSEVIQALKKRPSVYAVQAYKKVRTEEEEKTKEEFAKQVTEEKLRSMSAVKDARTEEQRKWQARVNDVERTLTSVTAEKDASNEKVSALEGELKTSQKKLEELSLVVSTSETSMQKLKFANTEIFAEKKAADGKLAELNDTVAKLEQEIEKLRNENVTINAKLSSQVRQVDVFRRVNESLMVENTEYKAKVDRMLEMFRSK